MNKTSNYQLNQWAKSDQVKMEDFNADNAKIDAAIKVVDQRVDGLGSGKADKAALNALQTVVNAKGNCKIITGSYIGDGQFGNQHPNQLALPANTFLVMVVGQNTMLAARGCPNGYIFQNGISQAVYFSWEDTSVSWYTSDKGAYYQMNESGVTYRYFAFLAL